MNKTIELYRKKINPFLFKAASFICFFTLFGCSVRQTHIEKKYDEIENKRICRLAHFKTRGPVKIILESSDKDGVNFLFSVISFNYLSSMAVNPKVLFKIHKNGSIQNLRFQGLSKLLVAKKEKDNKEIILRPSTLSPYDLIYANAHITWSDFNKIASADQVEVLIQTNRDPAELTLNQKDLLWFKEFKNNCQQS